MASISCSGAVVGLQIVSLYQHFHHVFRQERRQRRPEIDILHAERKQRQQDAHGLLLVPREHERERQVVHRAAEGIRQRERDLDGAVCVVALSHVENARQTADLAEIQIVEAVFSAGERQNKRIHRRLLDELGVVVSARGARRRSRRRERYAGSCPLLMASMTSSACASTAPWAKPVVSIWPPLMPLMLWSCS